MNQNSPINIHPKTISIFPRPIPYFNTNSSHYERELAKTLRLLFIPKITKRLPGHHLRGFSHKFIVNYVATHKKPYPYFIRTDIEKFYPNIEYKAMIVNVQLAYKDLLSLQYAPSAFRKKYVPALNQWYSNLQSKFTPINLFKGNVFFPKTNIQRKKTDRLFPKRRG